MTKKELESVYWLKKELRMWEERRAELEADICPPVKQITGMPFANTNENHSPTEEKAIRLLECTNLINEKIAELNEAMYKAEVFIFSVEDSQMRMILQMRCIGGYKWKRIATQIGDGYTAESVSKAYQRFIRKL